MYNLWKLRDNWHKIDLYQDIISLDMSDHFCYLWPYFEFNMVFLYDAVDAVDVGDVGCFRTDDGGVNAWWGESLGKTCKNANPSPTSCCGELPSGGEPIRSPDSHRKASKVWSFPQALRSTAVVWRLKFFKFRPCPFPSSYRHQISKVKRAQENNPIIAFQHFSVAPASDHHHHVHSGRAQAAWQQSHCRKEL